MDTVESTSDQRTVNNTASGNAVRHNYRVLTDAEKAQMADVKTRGQELIDLLNSIGKSREMSLAITNIEQGVMWAVKHITA